MTYLVPGAENKCVNPSFETNTTGWAGTNGTLGRVNTDSWVGDYCGTLTVTSIASDPMFELSAARPAVVENDSVDLTVRASAPVGRHMYISVEWLTAALASIRSDFTADYTATGGWDLMRFQGIAPATAAFFTLKVRMHVTGSAPAPPVVGDVFKLDGVDIRVNATYDTYVDGDQGDEYYWTGTAHASISRRRAEELTQRRGDGAAIIATPQLWVGNVGNSREFEIGSHILSGQIDMRNDRDIKLTFTGEIDDPDLIDPYTDYLIPVMSLEYPDGTVTTTQLGIYSFEPMPETITEFMRTGRFEARDLTWNLLQAQYTTAKSFNAGVNIVDTVRTELEAAGFTRHSITSSTETLAKKTTFKSTDSKLLIFNTLLGMIGYYPLHMQMDGRLASMPYQLLSTAEPTLRIESGDDSIVVGAIEKRKNPERICNMVRVIKEDSRTPANSFDYTYINDNPSSPTSTVKLQRTIVKEIKDNNIANITVAETIAKLEIERAASIVTNAEVTTLPVPARGIYEIYECDVDMDDGTGVLNGLWRVDGWTMGFTPQTLLCKHFINKLEPW